MAVRPNAGHPATTANWSDLKITLGAIDRLSPARLPPETTTFEANLAEASNVRVVFDGDVTTRTDGASEPGPGPFDIVYPFDKPYDYDPALGNLLIDWNLVGGVDALPGWDAAPRPPRTPVETIWSFDVNDPDPGQLNSIPVTSFGVEPFIPEPASAGLAIIAFVVTFWRRRLA